MKGKSAFSGLPDGVILRPALTPLEASVLPARERPGRAALRHIRMEQARILCAQCGQRQKIWVR
ncbi:MAG: hypothetical protein J6M47_11950 [Clostridia bacterium]|nr:hypothetical protein [Clostridia bacterium]